VGWFSDDVPSSPDEMLCFDISISLRIFLALTLAALTTSGFSYWRSSSSVLPMVHPSLKIN
jgi:hypothetical protein